MTDTAEDSRERRLAQKRAAAAKIKARLDMMSRVEQVAYKARTSLGDDFNPYTDDERRSLKDIRRMQDALEFAAKSLNSRMTERYREAVKEDPRLAVILAELEAGAMIRLDLKPH